MFKLFSTSLVLASVLVPGARAFAHSDTQNIAIDRDLQIPGDTLKPGAYTLSIEDRMRDRAIIRVSSASSDLHFLLLAVPKSKLAGGNRKGIILFDSSNQILRGWNCPNCSAPLELVYPKLEAVKITGETGQPVFAVDPASDKLPANLSADDMKVVTLWLLSPERVEAGHRGVGLTAVKYVAPAPPSEYTQEASASRRHLPKTASNTYWFGLLGVLSLALSLVVRFTRRTRRAPWAG